MTKYALITGAGLGIGYELSKAFNRRGYVVIGMGVPSDEERLNSLRTQIGLIPIIGDISNLEDVKVAREVVRRETNGKLDILYNNAGICNVGGPAIDTEDDSLRRIFEVNVLGQMYMTKYMSDYLIAAKGAVVFTASVATRVPLSWTLAYCATKAAIDQYALVLHGELSPFGVRVHSVITGGVNTPLVDSLGKQFSQAEKDGLPTKYYNVPGLAESLRSAVTMSNQPASTPAHLYAERVVAKIEKRGAGFNIYEGHYARTLHLLRWYAPLWLMEWAIQSYFLQRTVFERIRKRLSSS